MLDLSVILIICMCELPVQYSVYIWVYIYAPVRILVEQIMLDI